MIDAYLSVYGEGNDRDLMDDDIYKNFFTPSDASQ
jgi:hypothetical protein